MVSNRFYSFSLSFSDPIPEDLVKQQTAVNLDDMVSTEKILTRSDGAHLGHTGNNLATSIAETGQPNGDQVRE